jgi:hypothetical protein
MVLIFLLKSKHQIIRATLIESTGTTKQQSKQKSQQKRSLCHHMINISKWKLHTSFCSNCGIIMWPQSCDKVIEHACVSSPFQFSAKRGACVIIPSTSALESTYIQLPCCYFPFLPY